MRDIIIQNMVKHGLMTLQHENGKIVVEKNIPPHHQLITLMMLQQENIEMNMESLMKEVLVTEAIHGLMILQQENGAQQQEKLIILQQGSQLEEQPILLEDIMKLILTVQDM